MTKWDGVVPGIVTAVGDDGRLKVSLRGVDDEHVTDWIRIATMLAGPDKGSHFLPEIDDEVLVAFEHGNPRMPYVVGYLWNQKDARPATHQGDRRLQSKNGHKIIFLDSTPNNGDKGALIIEDAHGNRITMANSIVRIQSVGMLVFEGATIILNGRTLASNGNPI